MIEWRETDSESRVVEVLLKGELDGLAVRAGYIPQEHTADGDLKVEMVDKTGGDTLVGFDGKVGLEKKDSVLVSFDGGVGVDGGLAFGTFARGIVKTSPAHLESVLGSDLGDKLLLLTAWVTRGLGVERLYVDEWEAANIDSYWLAREVADWVDIDPKWWEAKTERRQIAFGSENKVSLRGGMSAQIWVGKGERDVIVDITSVSGLGVGCLRAEVERVAGGETIRLRLDEVSEKEETVERGELVEIVRDLAKKTFLDGKGINMALLAARRLMGDSQQVEIVFPGGEKTRMLVEYERLVELTEPWLGF